MASEWPFGYAQGKPLGHAQEAKREPKTQVPKTGTLGTPLVILFCSKEENGLVRSAGVIQKNRIIFRATRLSGVVNHRKFSLVTNYDTPGPEHPKVIDHRKSSLVSNSAHRVVGLSCVLDHRKFSLVSNRA